MKRMIMNVILMIVCMCCFAQAKIENANLNPDNLEYMIVVSCAQSKEMIFRAAKEWLATHTKDFQKNLQYEDKETGTIKVKYSSYLHAKKPFKETTINMTGRYEYIVTITCKDNKFRVKTNDVWAYWKEESYMYGEKVNFGEKRLEAIGFVKWCLDDKCTVSYGEDIGNLVQGIANNAKNLETEDDF